MMLMMNDEVVVEKAGSVEKEHSALAREIEFRLTPYLYQLGIPPQADKQGLHHRVCGYDPSRIRHGDRSLSAEKGEDNVRFYV